jgi:hypothetical protein
MLIALTDENHMLIMKDNSTWKSWVKIGRMVPLLTILAATAVGILSLLGHFQVTIAEGGHHCFADTVIF